MDLQDALTVRYARIKRSADSEAARSLRSTNNATDAAAVDLQDALTVRSARIKRSADSEAARSLRSTNNATDAAAVDLQDALTVRSARIKRSADSEAARSIRSINNARRSQVLGAQEARSKAHVVAKSADAAAALPVGFDWSDELVMYAHLLGVCPKDPAVSSFQWLLVPTCVVGIMPCVHLLCRMLAYTACADQDHHH